MTDEEYDAQLLKIFHDNVATIKALERNGMIEYVLNFPWSGYWIKNTNLVMRESEIYPEEFNITTRGYNILVKIIRPPDSIKNSFPSVFELKFLDKQGKELDDRFRGTADF